ncbi:hypothetical protein V5F77_02895 [Xanthobacter sp. DSM 24535]|uniref:hypothetical protein n=1 Tax=Roseixanthobacter psychrophilus TaxID=3119917 RepID=UPI003729B3DE
MGQRTGSGPDKKADAKLDKALEDSFPASDPPAIGGPHAITGPEKAAPEHPAEETCEAESDALDEALEESFPASDPPAQIVKRGADDAAPQETCPPAETKR